MSFTLHHVELPLHRLLNEIYRVVLMGVGSKIDHPDSHNCTLNKILLKLLWKGLRIHFNLVYFGRLFLSQENGITICALFSMGPYRAMYIVHLQSVLLFSSSHHCPSRPPIRSPSVDS